MPNRDGRGPRARSPRPSVRRGGLKRGGCAKTKKMGGQK